MEYAVAMGNCISIQKVIAANLGINALGLLYGLYANNLLQNRYDYSRWINGLLIGTSAYGLMTWSILAQGVPEQLKNFFKLLID